MHRLADPRLRGYLILLINTREDQNGCAAFVIGDKLYAS